MGTRNFKSTEAYNKWLAWGYKHKVFEETPGNQEITIAGKPHKVKHTR